MINGLDEGLLAEFDVKLSKRSITVGCSKFTIKDIDKILSLMDKAKKRKRRIISQDIHPDYMLSISGASMYQICDLGCCKRKDHIVRRKTIEKVKHHITK